MSVEVLQESACNCVHEIIMKGMEPLAKKELVQECLLSVLEKSSILEPQEVHDYSCVVSVTFLSKIVASIRSFLHIPRGEWVNVFFV